MNRCPEEKNVFYYNKNTKSSKTFTGSERRRMTGHFYFQVFVCAMTRALTWKWDGLSPLTWTHNKSFGIDIAPIIMKQNILILQKRICYWGLGGHRVFKKRETNFFNCGLILLSLSKLFDSYFTFWDNLQYVTFIIYFPWSQKEWKSPTIYARMKTRRVFQWLKHSYQLSSGRFLNISFILWWFP